MCIFYILTSPDDKETWPWHIKTYTDEDLIMLYVDCLNRPESLRK